MLHIIQVHPTSKKITITMQVLTMRTKMEGWEYEKLLPSSISCRIYLIFSYESTTFPFIFMAKLVTCGSLCSVISIMVSLTELLLLSTSHTRIHVQKWEYETNRVLTIIIGGYLLFTLPLFMQTSWSVWPMRRVSHYPMELICCLLHSMHQLTMKSKPFPLWSDV